MRREFADFDVMIAIMREYAVATRHQLTVKNEDMQFGFIDERNKDNWFVISLDNIVEWAEVMSKWQGATEGEMTGLEKAHIVLRAFTRNDTQQTLIDGAVNRYIDKQG